MVFGNGESVWGENRISSCEGDRELVVWRDGICPYVSFIRFANVDIYSHRKLNTGMIVSQGKFTFIYVYKSYQGDGHDKGEYIFWRKIYSTSSYNK